MAKKVAKAVLNGLFGLFVCLAIAYVVCMRVWPEQTSAFVGYRFYTVVTGSMEPTIPTTSVVLVRCLKPGQDPLPGQIVTFRADRLGEPIVLTHYLRETAPDETGRLRFYTQGENADRYDDYTTYRQDIIGTYVFHIPYFAKVQAFLISSQALSMCVVIGLILAVYKLMLKNMDLTEQLRAAGLKPSAPPQRERAAKASRKDRRAAGETPQREAAGALRQAGACVRLHGAVLERCGAGMARFSGEVENTGDALLENVLFEVRLFDGHSRQVGAVRVPLEGGGLAPAQRRAFDARLQADPLAAGYAVKVHCEAREAAQAAVV